MTKLLFLDASDRCLDIVDDDVGFLIIDEIHTVRFSHNNVVGDAFQYAESIENTPLKK